jgi:hypothetical protein
MLAGQYRNSMAGIIEVRPVDVVPEGGVYQNVRLPKWDNYGHGWSLDECEVAGVAVVEALSDFWQCGDEDTLIRATELAIQEPPLLGSKLARFITGAQTEIARREIA